MMSPILLCRKVSSQYVLAVDLNRMALVEGARFGPYEIIASIGTGGMGEVYRARDTRLNRDVALKILPTSIADNPVRRARFERESQAMSRLWVSNCQFSR